MARQVGHGHDRIPSLCAEPHDATPIRLRPSAFGQASALREKPVPFSGVCAKDAGFPGRRLLAWRLI
jgi:hypothetical protein